MPPALGLGEAIEAKDVEDGTASYMVNVARCRSLYECTFGLQVNAEGRERVDRLDAMKYIRRC